MNKNTFVSLLLTCSLSGVSISSRALAQEAPPVPAESTGARTQTPPSENPSDSAAAQLAPPPSPPPAAPPATPPPPSDLDGRVTSLEARASGTDESLSATRAITDKLNKIKLSGYIQGRYEWHDDSHDGLDAKTGNPASLDRFYVRRGRMKLVYEGTNAEYLLQVDAVGSGVTLKDAEATLVDTWTPFGFRLTVGQFKWPFGYEVLQSSGDREMPERALVIRRLFPGERDRGVRLQGRLGVLRLAAALVNGNGTQDAIYKDFDQASFKDLVGRVAVDLGSFVLGVSGYFGRNLATTAAVPFSVSGSDTNMDNAITADELTFRPATPATYRLFRRARGGADTQLYLDVPGLGGLALKSEVVLAKDTNLASGGTAADPCRNVTSFGWILTAVQNFGDYVGVVARVDSYDPNYSKSLDAGCAVAGARGDRVTTFGGGLLLYGSHNVKGTFVYEHLVEQESRAVDNDVFTAQLQARF